MRHLVQASRPMTKNTTHHEKGWVCFPIVFLTPLKFTNGTPLQWQHSNSLKIVPMPHHLQIACHNTQSLSPYNIWYATHDMPSSSSSSNSYHGQILYRHSPSFLWLHDLYKIHIIDVLKTNILSFDWLKNMLPWMNLKMEWSFNANTKILCTCLFDHETKSRQFEDTNIPNLSMATSNDEPI